VTLRLIHVGLGTRGRHWLEFVCGRSECISVAGVDADSAAREAAAGLAAELPYFQDLDEAVAQVEADAVRFRLEIEGVPTVENPATGRLVAPSVIATLRRLVAPLRQPLHDATLAARVEERFPLLENRLVSSLAFLDAETDPENSDSPALMRAVVAETADLAPAIKFNEVARSRTFSLGQPHQEGAEVQRSRASARGLSSRFEEVSVGATRLAM